MPPVARCRLLSSGFSAGHALDVVENLAGVKEMIIPQEYKEKILGGNAKKLLKIE